ncbi:hypothetical protein [Paenibacillus kribbensis]|uniref:Uncharacterized protein n=2 Tax=Paenibacillus TaxID=44249 RepID=A0A222WK63_9BACL|nr:hypothetical protein [Paenibacillus kribbensis]ASR46171.1 hypothetical protein B4V02_05435 [Paenibacillus kribbensis]
MTNKAKINIIAIKDIVRMEQVWEQEEKDETGLYYFHITDVLNRKWQTIGLNVSDAIQVFENGNDDVWTRIIKPAPFNFNLTANDLINMLDIGPDDWRIRNAIQIILNTVERRNEFVNKIKNINLHDIANLLYKMKSQYLRYAQLPNEEFIKMYVANPVEALSVYFLETVDVHTFWEWRDADGTYEKAIEYKREQPDMTLIQAVERAEDEACGG